MMIETWVVFHPNQRGIPADLKSVCTQADYDEMEQRRPGVNTLIQSGIGSESEAEAIVRRSMPEPEKLPRRRYP
jgi:hypothetical protein